MRSLLPFLVTLTFSGSILAQQEIYTVIFKDPECSYSIPDDPTPLRIELKSSTPDNILATCDMYLYYPVDTIPPPTTPTWTCEPKTPEQGGGAGFCRSNSPANTCIICTPPAVKAAFDVEEEDPDLQMMREEEFDEDMHKEEEDYYQEEFNHYHTTSHKEMDESNLNSE